MMGRTPRVVLAATLVVGMASAQQADDSSSGRASASTSEDWAACPDDGEYMHGALRSLVLIAAGVCLMWQAKRIAEPCISAAHFLGGTMVVLAQHFSAVFGVFWVACALGGAAVEGALAPVVLVGSLCWLSAGCWYGRKAADERQVKEILSIILMFTLTHAVVVFWSIAALAGYRILAVDIILIGLGVALVGVAVVCKVAGGDEYVQLASNQDDDPGRRRRKRIPEFWEEKRTSDGKKVFYYDHKNHKTHWKLPASHTASAGKYRQSPQLEVFRDISERLLVLPAAPGRHSQVPGLQLAQSTESGRHKAEMEAGRLSREASSQRHKDEKEALSQRHKEEMRT
jgi:hypothetical protein